MVKQRKVYIDTDGVRYYILPKIWKNTSPITQNTIVSLGWTIETEEINVPDIDYTDFNAACLYFRNICNQISEKAGIQDFKGGFEQMQIYDQTEFSNTLEGVKLAIKWSSANQLCIYEAKKLGIGQPEWWYMCWR